MRAESLRTEVAALTRYVHAVIDNLITAAVLDVIYRYRHPNLIVFMGYCDTKPILVYLYMHCESFHEWKVCTNRQTLLPCVVSLQDCV